ncbi:MAG: beta-ketoacyl-ACP synthase III [Candidatus Stygibacter australis]|nr:beta-ketoacyl-ACP synthase III [Candidatus Stygibacter australis]MDP8321528.1 beta-ketoacyl-ACP synthase III [Candidatus Stygibacter australis]
MKQYHAKIKGTGRSLPDKILNNFDLEKLVETSDEWIKTRTGMSERRVAADDKASSDYATEAAEQALQMADIHAKELDLVIVGTVTPDHAFPSTACLVMKNLGIKNVPGFDISAGCPGWIYTMNIAKQYIETGVCKNILTIGVDLLTRITNYKDRNTCVLFGDAAGASIVSRASEVDISRVIDSDISADGNYWDLLVQPAGGSRTPASYNTVRERLHTINMEGNKVFKLAVRSMYNSCETVLKRNNMDTNSLDWVIPHQANMRIIEALGKKLKMDSSKIIVNIDKYGNTSAATIPVALDEVIRSGKIRHGDLVLMTSFGAGLTSGSLLVRI